jgi:hypothetical protein
MWRPGIRGVMRRDTAEFDLEAIRVRIDMHAHAVLVLHVHELVMVDEVQRIDIAYLQPLSVEVTRRIGAEQPVQTGFEDIVAAPPARRQSTRAVMLLEKFDLLPAFARVDAGAESGDTAADDDDFVLCLFHIALILACHIPLARYRRSCQAGLTSIAVRSDVADAASAC